MRYRLVWMALVLASACSGDGDNAPPADPLYTIALSGDPRIDTIDALLPDPLVALVRRDGQRVADIPVRIRVAGCTSQCTTFALEGGEFYPVLEARTDAIGEVHVRVHLGREKGPALVVAEVTDAAARDTASLLVLAGAPDSLQVTPLDTALVIGSSLMLRAHMIDRGGNRLPIAVDIDTEGEKLLLEGDRVTALDFGDALVQVSAVSGSRQWEVDRRMVVVPPGRLVLSTYGGNLEVANTDGSERRALGQSGVTGGGWSPDGRRVAYAGSQAQLLVQRDLEHGDLVLTTSNTGPLAEMMAPSYSLAGDWIYFAGWPKRDNADGNQAAWEIWRVHPDGFGLARIGQPALNGDTDFAPSPAPDGNRVVWVTSRGAPADVQRLVIHDLSSGQTLDVPGAAGYWPSWSPVADSIAYLRPDAFGSLSLVLAAATGGASRDLAHGLDTFRYTQMGWSPDGAWVIATVWEEMQSVVVLVRASDGLVIRLPWSRGGSVTGSSWAAGMLR